MPLPILVLAVAIAIPAAARSTWSPCGWSMLSTVTPLAERARGHRYGVTASWFIAGAVAGGACLGALMAALAAGVHALAWSATVTYTLAGLLIAATALLDAGVFGVAPPFFKRQVNDAWLRQYRPWVYGGGFGWQIGAGLTTYIMTTAVPLLVLLAALTGRPAAAFAVGGGFGLARGSPVLLGSRITSPEAAMAFHRRFDALGEPVRKTVIAVLLVCSSAALWLAFGPVAGVVTSLALSTLISVAVRQPKKARAWA